MDLTLWLLPSLICQLVLFISAMQVRRAWRQMASNAAFAQIVFFAISLLLSLIVISRGRVVGLLTMRMIKLLVALMWVGTILATDMFGPDERTLLLSVALFWVTLNLVFLVLGFGQLRAHRRYLELLFHQLQRQALEQFRAEHREGDTPSS